MSIKDDLIELLQSALSTLSDGNNAFGTGYDVWVLSNDQYCEIQQAIEDAIDEVETLEESED